MNKKIEAILFLAMTTPGITTAEAQVTVAFTRVELGAQSPRACSLQPSPVDFCDRTHAAAYNHALHTKTPNFDNKYIITTVEESKEFNQVSVVAIDSTSGTVYPVPIDAFTPARRYKSADDALAFSLDSPTLCLDGTLYAFRSEHSDNACFDFDGSIFRGYGTPLINDGAWGKTDVTN